MYQTIHETIEVAAVFQHGKCTPKKFKWQGRILEVNKITLQSDAKDGGVKKRFYSIVSGANVYRLEYNRESEQWTLLEIWVD